MNRMVEKTTEANLNKKDVLLHQFVFKTIYKINSLKTKHT